MNRFFKLALGAVGIAAACALLNAPTFAENSQHGTASGNSRGSSGVSAPHAPIGAGPQHFPSGSGFSQNPQFYRPQSIGGAWQGQRSVPPYRGGISSGWQRGPTTVHGNASGALPRGFMGSHLTSARSRAFHAFRGRNISSLHGRDLSVWRGGQWRHSWHNGHFGWWWFAGGSWYFYDEPVYPYPDYVSDDAYDDDGDAAYGPGGLWYYCDAPQGFYPYVQSCMDPWRPVPAQ
jgi:hypothetical protein